MTTALTIVTRAAKQLNVVGKGLGLDSDDGEDGLIELNALIDELRTQRLTILANVLQTFTLVSNQGSYTIGPGGNFNIDRPVEIEQCYVTVSNTNRTLTRMDSSAFYGIPLPTTTASPSEYFYYEPSSPLGVLKLYPLPSTADPIGIVVQSEIGEFPILETDIKLAPGYENMLVYNLAIRLAGIFNMEPGPTLVRMAMSSLKNIKRINTKPIHSQIEFARPGRHSNIITGP